MYRSRKVARGLITGNEKAQYGLLRDYVEMIRRTDVGQMEVYLSSQLMINYLGLIKIFSFLQHYHHGST